MGNINSHTELLSAIGRDVDSGNIQNKIDNPKSNRGRKKDLKMRANNIMMMLVSALDDCAMNGGMRKPIQLGTWLLSDMYITEDENTKEIEIHFGNNSIQRNAFDTHNSFMPILLDRGWEVKKIQPHPRGINPSIINFYEFDGFHYIQKVIDEFNAQASNKGVVAEFLYNGVPVQRNTTFMPYMV